MLPQRDARFVKLLELALRAVYGDAMTDRNAADYDTYHAGPDVVDDDTDFAAEVESYLRAKLEMAAKRCGAGTRAVTLEFDDDGFTVKVAVASASGRAKGTALGSGETLDEAINDVHRDIVAWGRYGYGPVYVDARALPTKETP